MALGPTQTKAAWEDNHKHFTDERNMDRALVTRFMAHLNPNAVQSFQQELQRNLNQSFCDVFHWFLGRYGASNKMEQQDNKTRMEANWNPSNGVKSLINQINLVLRYATFCNFPITDCDTVNIAMHIVLETGLFKETYTTWHARCPNQRPCFFLVEFIREQCRTPIRRLRHNKWLQEGKMTGHLGWRRGWYHD